VTKISTLPRCNAFVASVRISGSSERYAEGILMLRSSCLELSERISTLNFLFGASLSALPKPVMDLIIGRGKFLQK
jgi:hypothetical protein